MYLRGRSKDLPVVVTKGHKHCAVVLLVDFVVAEKTDFLSVKSQHTLSEM